MDTKENPLRRWWRCLCNAKCAHTEDEQYQNIKTLAKYATLLNVISGSLLLLNLMLLGIQLWIRCQ